MKERFDYTDLKDMADMAARDNDCMGYRIELIKEALEISGYTWKELDRSELMWLAGSDHNESHLPTDAKLLPIICRQEFNRDIKTPKL
jgi:hypothetical protein